MFYKIKISDKNKYKIFLLKKINKKNKLIFTLSNNKKLTKFNKFSKFNK